MKYSIEVRNIHKNFGDLEALSGVSLKVEKGQIYGLLGPNGAGKTTLIRVMTTLLHPEEGDVTIGGINALKYPDGVRPIIGLAGQNAAVDDFLTGRETLNMIGRLYHLPISTVRTRTSKILEQMGLTDAANRTLKTYSGGMRRRLDLGASLVGKPKILFLDEPTTGLDPRTRLELWDAIRELAKQGTTIMLTTQYLEEADELADNIGVIDNGKMIAEGTADQLKTKMGDDIVEFTLSNPGNRETALKVVAPLTSKKPTYNEDANTVYVPVSSGAKDLFKIVKALDQAKIQPTQLSLHRPSLDEVFLSLTGKESQSKVVTTTKTRRNRGKR